ncbi:hypothetical protein [Neolewinella antarctica]|uniref:Uncharacterized protein n=1 Tax=Neolewinella antarctica TaxID=442734 RepID=A0ABX0XCJ0_9BACT|nr:hypothetical protein [Neolewinella antarctica]NJC26659.1 hypothetical protein [Neolewinella antarctica]
MIPASKSNGVICTLFEKTYHLGLAVFVNSLAKCGFEGDVYAGYRGELPDWSNARVTQTDKHSVYTVNPTIQLHFIRLTTEEHLTNIKPDFMLDLWENYCPEAAYLSYFDPDIVLKTAWVNILSWMDLGVAMCEDMNSPIPRNHPLRLKWKKYYSGFGISLDAKDDIYVNGGFVGVKKDQIEFLKTWCLIQEKMKLDTGNSSTIGIADRWNMFHFTDQDAVNITKDIHPDTTVMEKGAMDFGRVGYVMSHAAGKGKPWNKQYLRQCLTQGSVPTTTDKIFWKTTQHPIQVYPPGLARRKRITIKLASLIGRFMRRS